MANEAVTTIETLEEDDEFEEFENEGKKVIIKWSSHFQLRDDNIISSWLYLFYQRRSRSEKMK